MHAVTAVHQVDEGAPRAPACIADSAAGSSIKDEIMWYLDTLGALQTNYNCVTTHTHTHSLT